jgi:hypothetical protein
MAVRNNRTPTFTINREISNTFSKQVTRARWVKGRNVVGKEAARGNEEELAVHIHRCNKFRNEYHSGCVKKN